MLHLVGDNKSMGGRIDIKEGDGTFFQTALTVMTTWGVKAEWLTLTSMNSGTYRMHV